MAIAYVLFDSLSVAGYFFDAAYYRPAMLLCFLGAGVVGVYILSAVGEERDTQWFGNPLLLSLWPLVIAGLYLLQPSWKQVSVLATLEQGLRWGSYAGFLIVGFTVLKIGRTWASGILLCVLGATGVLLMIGGLGGWLGWFADPRLVMVSGDTRLSAIGARVAGTLEYPNMYGAVLAAFLAWYWQGLLGTGERGRVVLLFWVQAVPAGALLLLTESRAAWLIAAVVWTAGYFVVERDRKAEWLMYPLAAFSGSAVLYGWLLSQRSLEQTLLDLALPLFIAIGGAFGVGYCIRQCLQRTRPKLRAPLAWLCSGLLLLGSTALLPAIAAGRLAPGAYATAGARWQFYSDAWQLVQQAPWLGSGGDAWRNQMGRLQSAPYIGNEVHSGYLNLLLELGWTGLLLLIILVVHLLVVIYRSNRLGVLPALVLFLHAAVDFDMAYGFYWLLLSSFALVAMARPTGNRAEKAAVVSQVRDKRKSDRWRLGKTADAFQGGKQGEGRGRSAPTMHARRVLQLLSAALAVSVLVAAGLAGLRADTALSARQAALSASEDARLSLLRAGVMAHPYDTRMRLELAARAPLPERAPLLAAGLRYDPQSVPLLWALGAAHAERGDVQQAAAYLRRALQGDRYDKAKQSAAVQWLAGLAAMHREAGRMGEALAAAAAGAEVYARYDMLARRVELGGAAGEGRRFVMLPQATAAAQYCRELLRSHGYG
ncbi:O-antigen ligase family protein [Paenibacillus daejeonensis]|uniref:O-antigen ligase family protein n=1 Tax=Paenibacillus daejeonensis TaxID=135193 RepID=UPI001B7FDCAF|nr:O-antigen ligase family protein [Paenibacillus daejeonensis]